MRIGHKDNFLSIESVPIEGGYFTCRVKAVASASGRRFTALHDRLLLVSSEAIIKQFGDFETLKIGRIEISLSENGWFRFERDARGYITVRYRIAGWKASAAMEGEILIEGEFANTFCREFRALLMSQI